MLKGTGKIVIAVIVAVVVIGILIVYKVKNPGISYETEKVSRGEVAEVVSVTGSIAPVSRIDLQPEASGKIVSIDVKEGDQVGAGDLLLKMDSRDLESRIASQRAAVDAARAQLRELQAGATPEELNVAAAAVETARAQLNAAVAAETSSKTTLSNAEDNLENAELKADTLIKSRLNSLLLDYDEAVTVSGDAVNRLLSPLFTSSDFLSFSSSDAQAETEAVSTRREAKDALVALGAAVAAAKSADTVASAQSNYLSIAASVSVVKKHADACARVLNYPLSLSSSTLASYQLNANTAQSSLNAIISKLAGDKNSLDLQQRLNDTDITAAEIAVDNAEAGLTSAGHAIETSRRALEQAEASYELKKTGARRETIDSQRARVAAEEAALTGLLTDLSKRSIVAPMDAIVTDIPVELGETVSPGSKVVTLNTKDHFQIISNISEVDIAKLAVGQPVHITLDAFSTGESWTGKVVSIQPAEKVVEGVIFYETKIVFDEEDERLKSGMTANLDIQIARQENVLRVPLRALKFTTGRDYVEVLADGKVVEKDVSIGLESNEFAEITAGLNEGEEVVVGTNGKK